MGVTTFLDRKVKEGCWGPTRLTRCPRLASAIAVAMQSHADLSYRSTPCKVWVASKIRSSVRAVRGNAVRHGQLLAG